jgi:hypothetical protein
MNERIKLLAEQCWDWRLDGRHFDQEKFALLIIQECVDTISDCSVEYCTRPQIVSEIQEHFGVEE